MKTPFGTLAAWMVLVLAFGIFLPLIGLEHYYSGYVAGHNDAINPHHRQNQLALAKMLFGTGIVANSFLLLAFIKPVKSFLDDMTPYLLFAFMMAFGMIMMWTINIAGTYIK